MQSLTTPLRVSFVLLIIAASAIKARADIPACDAANVSGYAGKQCVVEIDRSKPSTPAPTILPNGTTVIVRVKNTRWNESIAFNTVTTQLPSQDILLALLKNFITPLQSLIGSQRAPGAGDGKPIVPSGDPVKDAQQAIDASQGTIEKTLSTVEDKIQNVSQELTCLEGYNVWTPSPDPKKSGSCDTTTYLTQASFPSAKDLLVNDLRTAIKITLPIQSISTVDGMISALLATCQGLPTDTDDHKQTQSACFDPFDKFKTNQARYNTLISDIQKQQDTLNVDLEILSTWLPTTTDATYTVAQPKNRTSVVTVIATEIVSKTPVTLSTITLTWQSSPWTFSAGILVSTLVNRTYAVSPVVSGGVISVATGTTTIETQIAETDTAPSIIFPLAQVNFRLNKFSRSLFGTRCSGHCGILVSAGMGPNLTTKSTDFIVGPSLQIKGVILTPVLDYGRENFLSGGLVPNQPLGTSPPSSLPTHTSWTPHAGFALTYVIPLPQ